MDGVVLTVDVEADLARTDLLTRRLAQDLRELGRVRVEHRHTDGEPGTKSATATAIGELVLTGALPAAVVTAVAQVIIACLRRSGIRSVTWQEGDRTVRFTGIDARDQRALAELVRDRLGTAGASTEDGGAARRPDVAIEEGEAGLDAAAMEAPFLRSEQADPAADDPDQVR